MRGFEENQLNCILNSENKNTQKELFAEENTDIVDYFEVECSGKTKTQRRMAGVRNFGEWNVYQLITGGDREKMSTDNVISLMRMIIYQLITS